MARQIRDRDNLAKPLHDRGIAANDNADSAVTQRLLTVDEASRYMGLSSHAMRHRISEGIIPYVRLGKRRILIDLRDLDLIIEQNKH